MKLAVVVPCYNEEAVLPETIRRLSSVLSDLISHGRIAQTSSIVFVDDGSKDATWSVIESSAKKNLLISGIKLSRNRGHQTALVAGLMTARGDAVISVDADLQDDMNAIVEMLDAFEAGSDVVYGVRRRRDTDSAFKRLSAEGYYRLLERMGVEIVFNHADYRLLSRRAIEALRQFGESNLFLRGLIPQLGFPSSIVYYDRAERFAGESKYPLHRMLAFAWQGITSFSATPLRAITAIGMLLSLGSFAVAAWALLVRMFTDTAVPGWASTVVPLYFLGGIQLLCTGIIGDHLAKIYIETKQRPRFFIDKTVGLLHEVLQPDSVDDQRASIATNEATARAG